MIADGLAEDRGQLDIGMGGKDGTTQASGENYPIGGEGFAIGDDLVILDGGDRSIPQAFRAIFGGGGDEGGGELRRMDLPIGGGIDGEGGGELKLGGFPDFQGPALAVANVSKGLPFLPICWVVNQFEESLGVIGNGQTGEFGEVGEELLVIANALFPALPSLAFDFLADDAHEEAEGCAGGFAGGCWCPINEGHLAVGAEFIGNHGPDDACTDRNNACHPFFEIQFPSFRQHRAVAPLSS